MTECTRGFAKITVSITGPSDGRPDYTPEVKQSGLCSLKDMHYGHGSGQPSDIRREGGIEIGFGERAAW